MSRFIPLLFLVAALAVGTWLFTGTSPEQPAQAAVDEAEPFPARDTAPPPDDPVPFAVTAPPEPAPADEEETGPDCLDEDALAEDPAWAEFLALQQSMQFGGRDFEPLLGIDADGLNALASQGDSAAMAALAQRSILDATGHAANDAAELLSMQAPDYYNTRIEDVALDVGQRFVVGKFRPEERLKLQDANYWLYQSALHGRVQSLRQYGEVVEAQLGGPVAMRWISREQFDAADPRSQGQFRGAAIYQSAIHRIVWPEIPERDLSAFMSEALIVQRDTVVNDIVAEFYADLSDQGLDLPADFVERREAFVDVARRACPGVVDELLDE